MHIINNIAYAGEKEPLLKVVGVKPLEGYRLWLRFSNGEARVFDFSPMFQFPVFDKLKDARAFNEVYLDYGAPTWLEGTVDLSPEMLYENSTVYQEP
jgi:hypothetical protein